jgi:hypothetical protein
MAPIIMKEVNITIAMDDLDFRIKNVAFETRWMIWMLELKTLHLKQRCSIGMTPLIKLQIGIWKIQAMHICIMICWIG